MNKLQKELRMAGAQADELDGLAELAVELQVFKDTSQQFWHRYKYVFIGLTSTAVFVLSVLFYAQTSLPGSVLYPIKRTSEQAMLIVKPSYRGTIMMRRAQEVQKLVDSHADTTTVLATLTDYQTVAAAYKTGHTSYTVYNSCMASLKTAVQHTSGRERAAIQRTLYSVDAS